MKTATKLLLLALLLTPAFYAMRRDGRMEERLREVVARCEQLISDQENLMKLSWVWNDDNGKPHTVEAKLAWDPDKTASQNKTAFQAVVGALKDLYPPN